MTKDYYGGPWKEIFSGKWGGYDVEIHENPEKYTLIQILEKQGEKTTGLISILNRYFVAEGNITALLEHSKGYSFVIEKHQPGFSATYVSISSGPAYSTPENASKTIEAELGKIEKMAEELNEKSKAFRVTLVELKNTEKKYWEKLFSEPILLPALMTGKKTTPAERVSGIALLGKKITGEFAEENMKSFARTVLIGPEEQLENLMKVVMENCVLNGVNVIAFDENDTFTRMSVPNNSFDSKTYPSLQPIGMPVKSMKPGEVKIDLNLMNAKMMREIIGVEEKQGDYLGKTAAELIDEVITKNSGSLRSLEDVEESLLKITAEEKKYHIYKAVRWTRVLKNVFPEWFGGKMETRDISPQYARTMGSITRVDLKNVPQNVKRAFVYSVMRSLFENFKQEKAAGELKVTCALINGEQYAPANPVTELQKSLLELMAYASDIGVGYCFGATHETDLFKGAVDSSSMKIEFVGRTEVAIKEENSRPYRATIRPRLSS
ncbi:MAG: hypothetical protein QXO69_02565 [archaeon]